MPNALFVRCRVAAAARSSLTVRPSPDAFTYPPTKFAPEMPEMSNRRVSEGADRRRALGVGLGSARNGEFEPFGEVEDPRERARLLDQGLGDLTRYWSGEFQPAPVQQPRIPVWVAAEWPHRRPVRRALRWDGLYPTGLPGPEALAELVSEIREARPAGDPFDVVVGIPPGQDLKPWARAGATWTFTDFGLQPTQAEVRALVFPGSGQVGERGGERGK
jgi:hypothetical protein